MEEITQVGVRAGGEPNESTDVVTPKKRSRRHLTQVELQFLSVVPLADVAGDINIFEGSERDRVSQGSLRILIKTNRRRSLYVHEKDLDLFLLVFRRHVERMGVPHADLPTEASALADATEWFDTRTSRWHLRVPNSDQVITSDPVRRKDVCGLPLRAEVFKRHKAGALIALKEEGKSQTGKGDE